MSSATANGPRDSLC